MPDNITREALELAFAKCVLELVEAGQIRPYRNSANRTWIHCEVPELPRMLVAIASEDFHAWLTDLCWRRCSGIPSRGLVARVCLLLQNRAHGHHEECTEEGIEQEFRKNPLFAALAEYMVDKGTEPHEYKASEWWTKLHDRASKGNFLQIGQHRFPGGANVMLRQLNLQREFLKSRGFEFKAWRSNGCQLCIWKRLDDVEHVLSAENAQLGGKVGDTDARTVDPANLKSVTPTNEASIDGEKRTDA